MNKRENKKKKKKKKMMMKKKKWKNGEENQRKSHWVLRLMRRDVGALERVGSDYTAMWTESGYNAAYFSSHTTSWQTHIFSYLHRIFNI